MSHTIKIQHVQHLNLSNITLSDTIMRSNEIFVDLFEDDIDFYSLQIKCFATNDHIMANRDRVNRPDIY